MDIIIVANFEEENGANSRFVSIANKLKQNHQVEIITSTFAHMPKLQKEKQNYTENDIKWTHCYESGYPKNICIKRFISHNQFGKNVKKYMDNRKKPDLVYLAVPSLSVGVLLAKYCKKNKVKFVVDIQDLWPEAFKMVFNPPIIGNLIYLPFTLQANKIFRQADKIIAVSKTYLVRGLAVNKKCKNGLVTYLGTDKEKFDKIANSIIKNENERLTLVYIGTLGGSYTLDKIILAIAKLYENGNKNIKLVVLGDGPCKQSFENLAVENNIDCEFLGYLPYEEMVTKLVAYDVAVNPIKDNAAQSIINKVGDYAMAGLPVINTQKCEEYRNEVDERNIGINCENSDINTIVKAIEIMQDSKKRKIMGDNNRKWAEVAFDRNITYEKIANLLEEIKDVK
ncbi:MAG: glycosyltransferase family 4 protein [Clostridia bacterium]